VDWRCGSNNRAICKYETLSSNHSPPKKKKKKKSINKNNNNNKNIGDKALSYISNTINRTSHKNI
jgi:hypothetical protein